MSGNDGVTETDLRALARFEDSSQFSAAEKAALRFAAALSRTPAEVSEEIYAAAQEWLTGPQLIELAGAVAWENFRSRFNRGFAVEAEGFSAGAYCALPEVE